MALLLLISFVRNRFGAVREHVCPLANHLKEVSKSNLEQVEQVASKDLFGERTHSQWTSLT